MVIPQPQQREATDRPLLPAEHNALKTAGDQTCGGNGGTQQTDLAIDAGTFRGERWRVNSSETV
ncbi:cell division protein [Escherichia coli]|uniref:Cell division protein n=1 Tax=Escherichia coli TaxID=562 RepID=A0A377DPB4_ECOLX|nr:cell division protein [Escherichia coli]